MSLVNLNLNSADVQPVNKKDGLRCLSDDLDAAGVFENTSKDDSSETNEKEQNMNLKGRIILYMSIGLFEAASDMYIISKPPEEKKKKFFFF